MADLSDNDGRYSPQSPSTPPLPPTAMMRVTFKSMMENSEDVAVMVPKSATVRELKDASRDYIDWSRSRLSLMYMQRELKNDDDNLSDYGMVDDCAVHLIPKMTAGNKDSDDDDYSQISIITIDEDELRQMLLLSDIDAQPSTESETQRSPTSSVQHRSEENDLQKKRMAELLRRRPPSASNYRSPISSAATSPVNSSGTTTPPPEHQHYATKNPVTHDELEPFVHPPETALELETLRHELFDPAETHVELMALRETLVARELERCGVCRRRLPLAQQTIKCRCGKTFCGRHRGAEMHHCTIDYKRTGRTQLQKENSK